MTEPKNCWEFFNCTLKEGCVAYQMNEGANCWQTVASVLRMHCIGSDGCGIDDCAKCEWYLKMKGR